MNYFSQLDQDIFFMEQALKEAQKSFLLNEVPVGCVVVMNNEIIARAHNYVEKNTCVVSHAEIICIQKASKILKNWRLTEAILYSTLEPCSMCAGAILLSRIKRLIWGASDLRMGASGSWINIFRKDYPFHSLKVTSGVLKEDSEKLMKDFFKKRRKKNNDS